MNKYLTFILAGILALSLSFVAIAEENGVSLEGVPDEMITAISDFEAAHPEMKDVFHLIAKDTADIAGEEYRQAFTQIQSRFGEMLETDGQQMDIPGEAQEKMRQTLQAQAALIDASFVARIRASEERMIAALRGQEYPEGEADVIATLKKISAEMEDSEDAHIATLKARLDQILETVEKDYNNDLGAWYREVSVRPELPAGETGRADDESHPPMPPEGEEKPDAGATEEGERIIPFNDHFQVIHEALKAATERIDERIQALAQEAAGKYQVAEDTAAEAFDLLNRFLGLVNGQIMEQLGNIDKMTFGTLMTAE